MKIKTILIAASPAALVVGAIAIFNPDVLTWTVVAGLSIVLGISIGVAARIIEPT